MRILSRLALVAALTVLPAVATAAIINPLPAEFHSDDGSQVFVPHDGALAIELFDAFATQTPRFFGFIFESDPGTLVPVFEPSDQGGSQQAFVNFITGEVIDVDELALQGTFAGSGNIAFFYALPDFGQLIFTVAALNAGGVDAAATFPKIGDPATYLLGFETLTDDPIVASYVQVTGVSRIPEPGVLALLAVGAAAWSARRRR